jgi:hypothetical protein
MHEFGKCLNLKNSQNRKMKIAAKGKTDKQEKKEQRKSAEPTELEKEPKKNTTEKAAEPEQEPTKKTQKEKPFQMGRGPLLHTRAGVNPTRSWAGNRKGAPRHRPRRRLEDAAHPRASRVASWAAAQHQVMCFFLFFFFFFCFFFSFLKNMFFSVYIFV